MKKIFFILCLFFSLTISAQNYTIKELSRRNETTMQTDTINGVVTTSTYTTVFVTVKYHYTDLNKDVTVEVAIFQPQNEAYIQQSLNNRAITERRKL